MPMATKAKRITASAKSAPAPERAGAIAATWPIALTLFLVSASGLAFQVTLTRVFSLLFQYHYAFLAISLAILGLSLGAVMGRVMRREEAAPLSTLLKAMALLSLSYPVAAVILAILPSTLSVVLHVLVALAPFVVTGIVTTLVFAAHPLESGKLYAADLFGAAAGIVASLVLLTVIGAFNTVIALGGVIALTASVLAYRNRDHRNVIRGAAGLALSLTLLITNIATGLIDYAPTRIADAPPDKTMIAVLRDPSQGARVVYSAWDPFARVDVVETSDPNTKYVFTDGGAGSFMLRFDGNLDTVASLRSTLEFLPFNVGKTNRTAILGAGAGKDVLMALLAGSADINAVEVNPAMVQTTRRFDDFTGGVFDRPEVELTVGDGRTFIEQTAQVFDLVYLNLVYSQAASPANQSLVENYIFTREAFRAYLSRLAPNGRLAIVAHNALEGTRAAITAIQAMQDLGVSPSQALERIALLMKNADDPTQRVTVLIVKREPLSADEIGVLQTASRALNVQPLHLPTVFELGFKPLKDNNSLDQFLAVDQTYNLWPTDDNRPFFYNLDPGVPAPVMNTLTFAVVLAALVLVVVAGRRHKRKASGGRRWALVAYVVVIGIGFMLIEVPLIQRLQLLLGYPTLSFALVLGALLLSGGAGSWISQRWLPDQLPNRVAIAAVWIGGLGIGYWLLLPVLLPALVQTSLAIRIAAVVVLAALIGLPMGVPFPSALRLAGQRGDHSVSLLWATNGAFSVLGSTLAIVLGMSLGFQWAMLMGAAAYLALAALTRTLRPA